MTKPDLPRRPLFGPIAASVKNTDRDGPLSKIAMAKPTLIITHGVNDAALAAAILSAPPIAPTDDHSAPLAKPTKMSRVRRGTPPSRGSTPPARVVHLPPVGGPQKIRANPKSAISKVAQPTDDTKADTTKDDHIVIDDPRSEEVEALIAEGRKRAGLKPPAPGEDGKGPRSKRAKTNLRDFVAKLGIDRGDLVTTEDGIVLKAMAHPATQGGPAPDDINEAALETVELDLPDFVMQELSDEGGQKSPMARVEFMLDAYPIPSIRMRIDDGPWLYRVDLLLQSLLTLMNRNGMPLDEYIHTGATAGLSLTEFLSDLNVEIDSAGGQREYAEAHKIPQSYLSAVLKRRKRPSKKLLDAMGGFKAEVVYRPAVKP